MNIDIANRFYELRKKNSLSQEELAEKIGVSRQAVSKWERAEASPDTDNLILLSKLYNISMDELLSTEEPVEKQTENIKEEKNDTAGRKEDFDDGTQDSFWMGFPYPVCVTIVYLILGFAFNLWHPGWILFITIPVYYSFFGYRCRKHRR